ncbi:MAG: sporulation protein YabP [Ruminococcaceae bacterium]|jgi:sporulation protein YabP|nr:sporulation protein YabP [Oscillospiraceae bacterium]
MSEGFNQNLEHYIEIEGRKKIKITGVVDIMNFDEETITILTVMGKLIIKGEELKILKFGTETGDMEAEGKFNAVVYLNDTKGKSSFVSKLFR